MSEWPRARLRIGEFDFDTSSFELHRAGVTQRLPHRLGGLLWRLARAPGEVLGRDTLIADVWSGRATDDVLSRAVADLRRFLADDSRQARYIETVPKIGYRLIAPVRDLAESRTPIDSRTPLEANSDSGTPIESGTTRNFGTPTDLGLDSRTPTDRRQPKPRQSRTPTKRQLALAIGLTLLASLAAWRWSTSDSPRTDPSPLGLSPQRLTTERPLTADPGWELHPSLSPDGSLVAFARMDKFGASSTLVARYVDGSSEREYAEPAGWNLHPAFSPRGQQLAFIHVGADGDCEVRLRPVHGDPSVVVGRCAGLNTAVAWRADGEALTFTAPADDDHDPGLVELTLATRAIEPLTQPARGAGPDSDPQYVPGGDEISFARGTGSDARLLAVTRDDAHRERTLFGGGNLIQGHAWSADGAQIIMATDWPGYRALIGIDPRTLVGNTLGARGARSPTTNARGDWAYEIARYDANIHRVDFRDDSVDEHALVASTRYDASIALSPDGRRLAFVSTRLDHESIWIVDTAGGDAVRAPLPDTGRWVRPAWSPTGDALLVTRYLDDITTAHRLDLASGRARELTALGRAFYAQYLEDGERFVFARLEATGYRLFLAPADGSVEPEALDIAGAVGEFYAGDHWLAWQRRDDNTLAVYDLRRRALTPLPDDWATARPEDWRLQGHRLYRIVDDEGQAPRLRRLDLEDGQTHEWPARATRATAPALAVAPDESFALFASLDDLEVDLMWVPAARSP